MWVSVLFSFLLYLRECLWPNIIFHYLSCYTFNRARRKKTNNYPYKISHLRFASLEYDFYKITLIYSVSIRLYLHLLFPFWNLLKFNFKDQGKQRDFNHLISFFNITNFVKNTYYEWNCKSAFPFSSEATWKFWYVVYVGMYGMVLVCKAEENQLY